MLDACFCRLRFSLKILFLHSECLRMVWHLSLSLSESVQFSVNVFCVFECLWTALYSCGGTLVATYLDGVCSVHLPSHWCRGLAILASARDETHPRHPRRRSPSRRQSHEMESSKGLGPQKTSLSRPGRLGHLLM